LVDTKGKLTVALDITITDELRKEGTARELVNRIQNIRKDNDFEITDKITVQIENRQDISESLEMYKEYVCGQTLCESISLVDNLQEGARVEWGSDEDLVISVKLVSLQK
jgi:isoleucyl-tRNA synthetase